MAGGTGAFQAGTMFPGFGNPLDILALGNVLSIAVATTGVAYSHSFVLRRGVTFGWEIKAGGSGVVAVTVELEQSNQPPTTEGSQDDAFSIPVGKTGSSGMFPSGAISAVSTHFYTAYSPVATILGRLKFTGIGSNDASTVINLARVYEVRNN